MRVPLRNGQLVPGGEGAGIADVLFGKHDTTGVMSFSWPASCVGNPLNGAEGALRTSTPEEVATQTRPCLSSKSA